MASDILLGRGYALDYPREIMPIMLPQGDRYGHFWCFGTTRVGKTRVIENMVEQDILGSESVLIIDPKGEMELFSKIVQLAYQAKRVDDLILLNPVYPQFSAHYNPLKHFYMIEELVGHIISGIAVGKEPFFLNVAYESALAIVQAQLMLDPSKKQKYSLLDVLNEVSHQHIGELADRVGEIDTTEAQQLAADLRKIDESGQDYYNKVSSSLRVALMELCSGNMGKIIGQTTENQFISKLEAQKGVIMVVQLGALMTRKSAYTAGKVVLSTLQSTIGRAFYSGREITPRLNVYIDEAQSILYPGIDELFAKGGGAGLKMHGFCQSVSQIYEIIGEHGARSILDNCNSKLFLRVTDPKTAQYISDHFGPRVVLSPIMDINGGMSFREAEEPAVRPENLLRLKKREFYFTSYEDIYFGRTTTTSPHKLRVKYPTTELVS